MSAEGKASLCGAGLDRNLISRVAGRPSISPLAAMVLLAHMLACDAARLKSFSIHLAQNKERVLMPLISRAIQ